MAAAALGVLAAARVAAPLLPRRPPGPGVESITRSFGAFLSLFFVPALPVRYGLLGWGTTYVAAAAALMLVTAAAVRGIADTFARSPVSWVRWLVQMAITVAAGLAAGAVASRLLRDGYPESRLLWAAAAFFIGATTTCALIDPHTRPRSLPGERAAARCAAAAPAPGPAAILSAGQPRCAGLYGCGGPRLWYGRGGAWCGRRGGGDAWLPGCADELRRPGGSGA